MWTHNCARVYVGYYVGGGTNEDEQYIDCKYKVVRGNIVARRLIPIEVQGTNSEGTMFTLQHVAIYPKSDTVILDIINSKGSHRIRLLKAKKGERKTIFKASI